MFLMPPFISFIQWGPICKSSISVGPPPCSSIWLFFITPTTFAITFHISILIPKQIVFWINKEVQGWLEANEQQDKDNEARKALEPLVEW